MFTQQTMTARQVTHWCLSPQHLHAVACEVLITLDICLITLADSRITQRLLLLIRVSIALHPRHVSSAANSYQSATIAF